jgi:DNA-binding response OmpR family regulator
MNQTVDKILREINQTEKNTFSKEEIISFIENISNNLAQKLVESNGIIVDPTKRLVKIDNKEIHLPNKVFNLLHYFISHKNEVLTREQIFKDIWGFDFYIKGRTVDIHIKKLRNFLPQNYIETTIGRGYTWIEK